MSSPHPVWLIHGWAANHHIFDPVYAALPHAFQAAYHAPDLPGHGTTALSTNAFDLSAIAAAYAAQVSEPAHILGWSLGGMVAIKMAAHYPDKVASLCLVDSLPKVMADANYPQGLKRLAFADMVAQFETNYQQSMGQFLGLQMMYAAKETRRQVENLLPTIAAGGTPTGLRAALAALLAADLRPDLPLIRCPTLLIYGQRDALTPVRMGEYLHQCIPQSQLHIIPQAAHAPFLSHTTEFTHLITYFWERLAP